jgi:hypothetical protein
MATCLAALPDLEDLRIEFQTGPDHMDSSSLTCTVLPSLTSFHFKGVSEYLEHFVALLDAPLLQTLSLMFNDDMISIPQHSQFLSRTERLESPNRAVVEFSFWKVDLKFIPPDNFELGIKCDNLARQVSSTAAVCRELSTFLSRVERLDLRVSSNLVRQDELVPTNQQWLGLFKPFITMQSLFVSKELESLVSPALEELTRERTAVVFPKLRTLFL